MLTPPAAVVVGTKQLLLLGCVPPCGSCIREQLLYINVQQFRGGLVFKAHRLVYNPTLGLRVVNERRRVAAVPPRELSRWLRTESS